MKMILRTLKVIAFNAAFFAAIYYGHVEGVEWAAKGSYGFAWFMAILGTLNLLANNHIRGEAPAPEWFRSFDGLIDVGYIFMWFALGFPILASFWVTVLAVSQISMKEKNET